MRQIDRADRVNFTNLYGNNLYDTVRMC